MTLSMNLTRALLRLRHKSTASEETMRASVNPRRPPSPMPARLLRQNSITIERADGHEVVTITPRNVTPERELIYLHGGAYVHNISGFHWGIIRRLLRHTHATITVPLYGLAPEHTAEKAYEFLEQVYSTITKRSTSPLFLIGDSAGAGLAIGFAIKARDTGLRPPSGLVLFSPWVDITMQNPEIEALAHIDHVLGVNGLRAAGLDWASSWSTSNPLVSPINDSLRNLPPMTILQGGREILLPDVQRFAVAAQKAGSHVDLRVYPSGFHVFVAATWTAEAKSALGAAKTAILQEKPSTIQTDREALFGHLG